MRSMNSEDWYKHFMDRLKCDKDTIVKAVELLEKEGRIVIEMWDNKGVPVQFRFKKKSLLARLGICKQ